MIKTDITISNKLGLHARAAAKLTKLAAGIGSTVTLETDGEQEQQAMDALRALIDDKFGEGQ